MMLIWILSGSFFPFVITKVKNLKTKTLCQIFGKNIRNPPYK